MQSRTAIWLFWLLCLTSAAHRMHSREIFLHRQTAALEQAGRSDSLAGLLQTVARDYLHGCTLSLIYDSSYEQGLALRLRAQLQKLSLSFTYESVDTSKGEVVRNRRTADSKCNNYLLFLESVEAIKHVLERDHDSRIVLVSPETPWRVKDFLKSDVARYYANLLLVCPSTSRSIGGAYLIYTNKLYADGSGASQPLLLTSWLNGSRLSRPHVDLFYDKLSRGFMGHRLIVSTAENPPFTIKRIKNSNEEAQWDGLEVRILRLAASYLNFSVEFTQPRSQYVASLDAVKADVAQGITSMAIGGIYYTIELTQDFDATTPHYEDCAVFISLASTALPKYRAVLGPFQPSVWVMLCLSYFLLIVPLSFNSKYSILSLLKHPSGLNNMFWFVFSTYTNSFVVKSPLLNYGIAKNSTTLLIGIYWMFTIIITACYTGSIVAFITLPVFPAAMETAEEFAYYRYRIGTLDHNGWEKWFNASQVTQDEHPEPLLKKLFRRMEYVPSLLEGVQNASRAYFWPYAFLGSKTALDYLVQTDFAPSYSTKRSLMHVSDECFLRFQVVQLLPAKSLYTDKMNKFVTRANEHGLFNQIINDIDWEVQRIATFSGKKITKGLSQAAIIEDRQLSVEDTQGMFLVLATGVLMAVLSLTCENLNSRFNRRKLMGGSPVESRLPSAQTYWPNDVAPLHQYWMNLRLKYARGSI